MFKFLALSDFIIIINNIINFVEVVAVALVVLVVIIVIVSISHRISVVVSSICLCFNEQVPLE